MNSFPIQTLNSAPEGSKAPLQQLQDGFGFLPNVAGVIANSPVLMKAFVAVFGNVHSGTFTEDQIQVVLLTDAVVNSSTWPVAFHSTLAIKNGVHPDDVKAIRESRLPANPKHAALSGLARELIEKRGHASPAQIDNFLQAGFSQEQLLETLTIIAASTITNYAATLGNPPLEAQFQEHAWSPKA